MKKLLLAFIALFFYSGAALAQEEPQVAQSERDWFIYYYLEKDSSKVPDFLADLQKSKRLDKHAETIPSVEGFLSIVFAANPDKVDSWTHGASYSGKLKSAIAFALKGPVKPDTIKNANDLGHEWGAYYASGNEQYLKQIVAVLDKPDKSKNAVALHQGAAYSLGANMTEHESVNRFLMSESATHSGPAADDLKQIIAGVQKQRQTRAFPNHNGDFSAIIFTTDPNQGASSSHEVLHFKEFAHAKAGDKRALVIVFAGMELSPDYDADVTYDVTITDPDGKTMTDQKGLEAIKRKLPSRFRVFNNKAVIFLDFDAKDTPGVYKVSVTLNDNVGKKSIPLTYKLTLDK